MCTVLWFLMLWKWIDEVKTFILSVFDVCLPSMMSPCEMCKLPGSPDEWFSRQTTCIPGRMSDLCVSVGVVALPADPDCDDVPTPELRDKTSTCGSGREREREEFKFGESRLKRKKIPVTTRYATHFFHNFLTL